MSSATYYDMTTGQILGSLTSVESDILANQPAGSGRISGVYDPDEYYVDVQNQTITALPDRPANSEDFVFNYETKAWVDGRGSAQIPVTFRYRRNQLLLDSDWTQLPDAPADASAWKTYRQQLRALAVPTTAVEEAGLSWPVSPS
jgi:hypothetical protein